MCNNVNDSVVENMNKKTKTNNSNAQSASRYNYFAPLQTVDDDISDDEIIVKKTDRVHIPPISILKCKTEEVHELCKAIKITDYAISKISIGLKLFLKSKSDFDSIHALLIDKYQFFTYATKSDKPYKAILFGLDNHDPMTIKQRLIAMGLKCLDVKIVVKRNQNNSEYVFYDVYLQRQTMSIKELRQLYSVIECLKVRWQFQRANKTQITQCHNCQMFGHGSSRCKVKTYCAN